MNNQNTSASTFSPSSLYSAHSKHLFPAALSSMYLTRTVSCAPFPPNLSCEEMGCAGSQSAVCRGEAPGTPLSALMGRGEHHALGQLFSTMNPRNNLLPLSHQFCREKNKQSLAVSQLPAFKRKTSFSSAFSNA